MEEGDIVFDDNGNGTSTAGNATPFDKAGAGSQHGSSGDDEDEPEEGMSLPLDKRVRLNCRNYDESMLSFSMSYVNQTGERIWLSAWLPA